jgi:hypothetical protein
MTSFQHLHIACLDPIDMRQLARVGVGSEAALSQYKHIAARSMHDGAFKPGRCKTSRRTVHDVDTATGAASAGASLAAASASASGSSAIGSTSLGAWVVSALLASACVT